MVTFIAFSLPFPFPVLATPTQWPNRPQRKSSEDEDTLTLDSGVETSRDKADLGDRLPLDQTERNVPRTLDADT